MNIIGHGNRILRKTQGVLSRRFGPERDKPVVVALLRGDLIALWPLRCRGRQLTISALDLYGLLVERRARQILADKEKLRKERKRARLERAQLKRQEKALCQYRTV